MLTIIKNTSSVLLSTLVLYGCSSNKAEELPTDSPPVVVTIRPIELSGQPEAFAYSGSVEADNSVSVGFIVSGRVSFVNVQEGQRVSAGQLLASIETADYVSSLRIAQAVQDQAEDNFNRLSELHDKGSLPERDFISARSSLIQAQANTSLAEKRLADTRLYAPYDGIVSAKLIEKGATAAPGVPAFTVLKTDQVYATASVAESEINKLAVGKSAVVFIPVLKDSLKGTITIINPQADNSSKTYLAKIRLNNKAGKLLPGMIADITVQTGGVNQSVIIPANAIVRDEDNLTYVFIADNGNTAVRRRITLDGVTGENEVIVKSGLQAADKLIISGQTRLADGSKIKF